LHFKSFMISHLRFPLPLPGPWATACASFLLALAFLSPSAAHAGVECEEGEGWALLKKLANGKVSDKELGDGNNSVDLCLLGPRSWEYWRVNWHRTGKTPIGVAGAGEEKDKIQKICAPAFRRDDRKRARRLCIPLLVYYGVKEFEGKSLLDWGEETYECGFPLMSLPQVEAGREAAQIAERSWKSDTWTHCGYGGCACIKLPAGKRKRALKRQEIQRGKLQLRILNALSYVGDSESVRFIREHALGGQAKVVERAKIVLDSLSEAKAPEAPEAKVPDEQDPYGPN
jgi:hypothetical protein